MRALQHIHQHLDTELTPEQLATVSGFSLHHFHRVFRGMVGESVMGYVRRLRIEQAAFRLQHGKAEILSVALLAGYESHEAFTRAFKAQWGLTPSAFRDRETLPAVSVTFRTEPTRSCLALRRTGDYLESGQAWAQLSEWVLRFPDLRAPPHIPFGLVYDDPDITPPERCRYDACWPIVTKPPHAQRPDWLRVIDVPGGTYAVTEHQGPYDTMRESYVGLLGRALPRCNLELAPDPVLEVYLNAPNEVPPDQLRTQLCVRCEDRS